MNLYGLLIAKDEGDILEQTLLSLRAHGGFKQIFFYDNGSSDNTLQIARKFNDLIPHAELIRTPFSDQLKYQLLNSHAEALAPGDWMAILDADEFYAESALEKIEQAEAAQANCIEAKSAQFYMTPQDASTSFDPSIAAIEQRKHYLINYGEPRLFKYQPGTPWTEAMVKQRQAPLHSSPHKLLLNHFQFRSATQLQKRIDIRLSNNKTSGNWGHVQKAHWHQYLVNAKYLHAFNGEYQYGLPANVSLYKTPNNDAYTAATLRWMRANDYLNQEQIDFFSASKLQKIIRRFF